MTVEKYCNSQDRNERDVRAQKERESPGVWSREDVLDEGGPIERLNKSEYEEKKKMEIKMKRR